MIEAVDPARADAPPWPLLVADIGGTNARFGWQRAPGAPITDVVVLACARHASLLDATRAYLARGAPGRPAAAAIGIASPVTGDHVAMTNLGWRFSIAALRAALGLARLRVLNDFTALALALPQLQPHDWRPVGGGPGAADAAIALVGPGTGFGVSGLLPAGPPGRWLPIAGEGGHVTLAARDAAEFAIVERLRERYGHASAERVLSGSGLVDLYAILGELDRAPGPAAASAAEVLALAGTPHGGRAERALECFLGFLGSVAGDVALTLGARGGVYVGGGIVPRLLDRIDASPLRERFEAKGRYRDYLRAVPLRVIVGGDATALRGAAEAIASTCIRGTAGA